MLHVTFAPTHNGKSFFSNENGILLLHAVLLNKSLDSNLCILIQCCVQWVICFHFYAVNTPLFTSQIAYDRLLVKIFSLLTADNVLWFTVSMLVLCGILK